MLRTTQQVLFCATRSASVAAVGRGGTAVNCKLLLAVLPLNSSQRRPTDLFNSKRSIHFLSKSIVQF